MISTVRNLDIKYLSSSNSMGSRSIDGAINGRCLLECLRLSESTICKVSS